MDTKEIIAEEQKYILSTYKRPSFVLERGEGMYLFDLEGNKYLDFVGGLAVNALGYGDKEVLAALNSQAEKLIHCSNLFHSIPGVKLAKLLIENSFAEKVFFCNSGTEAIEGALKFARKWASKNHGEGKQEIIAFENSFHGRSYGALSATGQPKYQRGFGPLLPGFHHVKYNDLSAVKAVISPKVCAVLVEPVQGEGGIFPAKPEFLAGLRQLCDQNQALLIFDEIQCGLGRTGNLFAYQTYGVVPDLLTLAKPLAGGLPMGAILLNNKVAEAIQPGDHGATFGGNPLVCQVALTVLNKLIRDQIPQKVQKMSNSLLSKLEQFPQKYSIVEEVRGLGLMIALQLTVPSAPCIEACAKRGLLVCKAGDQVLRLLPPLIVQEEHIDQAVAILGEVFDKQLDSN